VEGVLVVARPSDAIDSTSASLWTSARSGTDGTVKMDLKTGSWTLEASWDSLGMRMDVDIGPGDQEVCDTLLPLQDLTGSVVGIPSGTKLYLPGLARSTRVLADGSFRFPSLPHGTHRLRLETGQEWTVVVPGPNPVLVAGGL
jgi:hypothetical protein